MLEQAPYGGLQLVMGNRMLDNLNRKKQILLLDDNPALSRTFSILLQQYGYDVIWVSTPQQATAAIQQNGNNVWGALLDLSIVKTEGMEWFRTLEKTLTAKRIAIWSGACPDKVELAFCGIGIDCHLMRKPPTDTELRSWLDG